MTIDRKVEAIIVLLRDMFYTTDISVTHWIVNMNKKAGVLNGRQPCDRSNEILYMDLRRWDSNIEEIVIDKGKKKRGLFLLITRLQKLRRFILYGRVHISPNIVMSLNYVSL